MSADDPRRALPSPWAPWAWRHWMRWWPVVFFAAFAIAVGGWWMEQDDRSWRMFAPMAGLAAWAGVWRFEVVRVDARTRWTLPTLAFVAVLLSLALTQQNLGFWIVGLALIPMFFVILEARWSIAIAVLLAAHAGIQARITANAAPLAPVALVAFLVSRGVLLVLLGLFVRAVVRQAGQVFVLSQTLNQTRHELSAAERLAGVLEERHRVARELHDTVTQGLSATVMHIEAAEQQLSTRPDAAVEQLHRASAVARESLEDMRRVVGAMRPDLLEHAELPEAIARAVAQWAERTGIPARCTVTGVAAPLHAEADITVLRAVQESLTNVRKHAQATQVAVTLSYMGEAVRLDVRDNGRGMDAAALALPSSGPGHFGFVAMRERVEALGGEVVVESETGQGTTVSVSLPTWQTAETRARELSP